MDVKAIENLNIDRVLQRGTGKIIEQRQDAFAEKLECYQVAYYHTEMAGFVGEHLEGSIGLLHVMPKFRRKGYAMALQKKLGLTQSENTIIWMWR
ncbi:MAG: hypothetical protein E7277_00285 [Lachnospiraceae bacterium]|nr:hypothetical protein [Lachnospiraceae bacterium]